MPYLIVSYEALSGIRRCRRFLEKRNPKAADKASLSIKRQISALRLHPEMGRLLRDAEGERELVIAFGDAGYIARYRYEPLADRVIVLAFRHQREAGY